MESFAVLTQALDYIEGNLCNEIMQEDIAKHCAYSLSSLQKMFKRTFRIGIADYIARRRISAAARELIITDKSVLEIALSYGYNSHEVFIRNFTKIWGETPSRYRKNRHFTDIFPRFDMPITIPNYFEGGIIVENKRRFDITELYDYLVNADETYILSFDMCHLMHINDNHGSAAGDIAIAECLKRIDSLKDDDMIMFRIGGDEFILITNTSDREKASEIGRKILELNGNTIIFNGEEIPVSMKCGMVMLESRKNFKYDKLFTELVIAGRTNDI